MNEESEAAYDNRLLFSTGAFSLGTVGAPPFPAREDRDGRFARGRYCAAMIQDLRWSTGCVSAESSVTLSLMSGTSVDASVSSAFANKHTTRTN